MTNALPTRDLILDILPVPFEWCEIPAGQVTLEDNAGTFDIQPFLMAKYPITYEQFQVFIDDPQGFTNLGWWLGLAVDRDHRRVPGGQRFTRTQNLPREGVSWYDAMAFCRWLTAQTRRVGAEDFVSEWAIRLPTEWEWQWAAQGPDRRVYPWGNKYIKGYANVDEGKSGIRDGMYLRRTTPVGRYPKGDSPYGVLDMSGNVWEWCLNEYQNSNSINTNNNNSRAVRGGSYGLDLAFAHVTSRKGRPSHYRGSGVGFRVMCGFHPEL